MSNQRGPGPVFVRAGLRSHGGGIGIGLGRRVLHLRPDRGGTAPALDEELGRLDGPWAVPRDDRPGRLDGRGRVRHRPMLFLGAAQPLLERACAGHQDAPDVAGPLLPRGLPVEVVPDDSPSLLVGPAEGPAGGSERETNDYHGALTRTPMPWLVRSHAALPVGIGSTLRPSPSCTTARLTAVIARHRERAGLRGTADRRALPAPSRLPATALPRSVRPSCGRRLRRAACGPTRRRRRRPGAAMRAR